MQHPKRHNRLSSQSIVDAQLEPRMLLAGTPVTAASVPTADSGAATESNPVATEEPADPAVASPVQGEPSPVDEAVAQEKAKAPPSAESQDSPKTEPSVISEANQSASPKETQTAADENEPTNSADDTSTDQNSRIATAAAKETPEPQANTQNQSSSVEATKNELTPNEETLTARGSTSDRKRAVDLAATDGEPGETVAFSENSANSNEHSETITTAATEDSSSASDARSDQSEQIVVKTNTPFAGADLVAPKPKATPGPAKDSPSASATPNPSDSTDRSRKTTEPIQSAVRIDNANPGSDDNADAAPAAVTRNDRRASVDLVSTNATFVGDDGNYDKTPSFSSARSLPKRIADDEQVVSTEIPVKNVDANFDNVASPDRTPKQRSPFSGNSESPTVQVRQNETKVQDSSEALENSEIDATQNFSTVDNAGDTKTSIDAVATRSDRLSNEQKSETHTFSPKAAARPQSPAEQDSAVVPVSGSPKKADNRTRNTEVQASQKASSKATGPIPVNFQPCRNDRRQTASAEPKN